MSIKNAENCIKEAQRHIKLSKDEVPSKEITGRLYVADAALALALMELKEIKTKKK